MIKCMILDGGGAFPAHQLCPLYRALPGDEGRLQEVEAAVAASSKRSSVFYFFP